jgi:hypothetical protein
VDYDQLKQTLEEPPETVVPVTPFWTAPLLPEDPEWPTPKHWTEESRLTRNRVYNIDVLVRPLPRRQKVLCALIAAESVTLPEAEASVGAIDLMWQWLSVRNRDAWKLVKAAREVVENSYHLPYGAGAIDAAVSAATSKRRFIDRNVASAAYRAAQYAATQCVPRDERVTKDWWDRWIVQEHKYLVRWWSECRRALCFSDAATASITVHGERRA